MMRHTRYFKIGPGRLKMLIILNLLIIFGFGVIAQDETPEIGFKQVSRPEKWWAVWHPFIAFKAFDLTRKSLKMTNEVVDFGILGDDLHGGQADAFKHAYWMALLTQHINWRKAFSLGKAHEKGDYLEFKRAWRKGKFSIHDEAASEMDLQNDRLGVIIGVQNPEASETQLRDIIIDAVHSGQLKIIKKNENGESLDRENNVIPIDSLKGRWKTERVLVPSDYW